jgi:phosphoglycolate phosphatase
MSADRLPAPRAVLFDWDNTLVDTWPVIHDAMASTLEAMGHRRWTLEETRTRVRRSLREAFPELFGDRWEEARDVFYARFREIHLEKLAVQPGAEALLAVLRDRGCWLGVVSNKMGDHLRREVSHLGWSGFFSRIVGATDAPRDKPAVEPVTMALEGSGLVAGPEVWFVGDTWIDMECAHNAGCLPILIRKDAPEPIEFGSFLPHMHFAECQDLTKHVGTY